MTQREDLPLAIEVTKAEREWLEDTDLWPWKEE